MPVVDCTRVRTRLRGKCSRSSFVGKGPLVDYVEFVDRVIDAISVQWRAAGPDKQMMGVGLQKIADELLGATGLDETQRFLALLDAIRDLEEMGLVTVPVEQYVALSQEGRKFPDVSLESAWHQIFDIFIDQDQTDFLTQVVDLSMIENEEYAALRKVDLKEIDAALGSERGEGGVRRTWDNAQSLDELGLAKFRGYIGGTGTIRPTYMGVVRATRGESTELYQLISRLVAEGETTNVDFKRELNLNRHTGKAELVRDVLALGNTKSSGERFLIIGIADDGTPYGEPVDPTITQERLEQVLQSYAEPWPTVRYRVAQWQTATVGLIQVLREPEKLPYMPTRTLAKLVEGRIYVRHGSHTEPATARERESLLAEGTKARDEA